ncbi:hypothetical protein KIPB_004091 [Kipferlia bialata]|uniref:Uncharacterized protein n=1 Tax=Kipferlia bialata TaxID=797122 RepID=A0A9K3GHW6_9EUKA|nr:hypothetical protein KIPB_004091 [Kipferlia bialata]|eukprot:g4091.t1
MSGTCLASAEYASLCPSQTAFQVFYGVAIIGGVVVSLSMQLLRMTKLKSCVGVSGAFLMIATLNQSSMVVNSFTLNYRQVYRRDSVGE